MLNKQLIMVIHYKPNIDEIKSTKLCLTLVNTLEWPLAEKKNNDDRWALGTFFT
jgi:hypothetical protein